MSENFGPEDVSPSLYINDFDGDQPLSEFGHDIESSLALIVRAIIAAHLTLRKPTKSALEVHIRRIN